MEKMVFVRCNKKMVLTLSAQALLWIWFLGCTTTWRFGKVLLVEGMGIKSAEFTMLCLYSIGLVAHYSFQPKGKWILFVILALWFVIPVYGWKRYLQKGRDKKLLILYYS